VSSSWDRLIEYDRANRHLAREKPPKEAHNASKDGIYSSPDLVIEKLITLD
jgi:hypothetical protein